MAPSLSVGPLLFDFSPQWSLYTYALLLLVPYIVLCRTLRNRRYHKQESCLNLDRSNATLTLAQAQAVQLAMSQYDFPRIFTAALQFALFRTYGIPSISKILWRTRQLASPSTAGRRYADTVVIIGEISSQPLDSERAATAIARMNWLHQRHRDITQDDLVYTLLLFATQPCVFLERMEWRKPTTLEKRACCLFWREVGRRMDLDEAVIPKSFEGMLEWIEEYEKKKMVYEDSNKFVADKTVDLLLYYCPSFLRPLGRNAVYSLCDPPLRTAMGFPDPPALLKKTVWGAIYVRRFILRNFALPRRYPMRKVCEHRDAKTGRLHTVDFDNEPWYFVPTFWSKWGFWGWWAWAGGFAQVGEMKYRPEGYEIENIGPVTLEGKGLDDVREGAEKIKAMVAGCPFAI